MIKSDTSWDKTVDVVVVGYGMAGSVTAITARDLGSEVMIVEKSPREGFHSNSSMAGLTIMGANDVGQAIQHLEELNHVNGETPWTDSEVIKGMAEYFADSPAWLKQLGGNISFFSKGAEHRQLPGSQGLELWAYAGMGLRMMEFLYGKVSQRGIEVAWDTAAGHLLTNLRGEVTGVRVKTGEGKQMDIGAHRAVVLACGGFEFNERMKLNYLKAYPSYFTGTELNTGDGIKMALDVGADLWHMNCVSARFVLKYPEMPWAIPVDLGGPGWTRRRMQRTLETTGTEPPSAGYVIVDRGGKRFTNEVYRGHCVYYELGVFDTQRLVYPRIPSYWIFDQRRVDEGRLPSDMGGVTGPHQMYRWSNDNSHELEKGWIFSDAVLRNLARKIDVPEGVLEKTVADYNRYCERGQDDEFGRPTATLTPLDKPPFYACRLWPGGPNTQGGPRRNLFGRIVNPDGVPVGRLYGAGELGSVFGMLYPIGGGNLGECIASGRVAGENAAREKPMAERKVS